MAEVVSPQDIQQAPLSHEQLGEVYQNIRTQLLAYLHGRVPSPEDTLQDLLVRMTERIHRGEFIDRNPGGYMYRAARHLAIDEYRRKIRRDMSVYSIDQHQEAHPAFDVADPNTTNPSLAIELSDRMQKALSKLSERYRKALILYEIHGLEYGEIAELIGTTETGMKQFLSRARNLLKEAYASLEEE